MSQIAGALIKIKKGLQVSGLTLSDVVSEYDRQRTGLLSLTQPSWVDANVLDS
jgi:hypothetical protein